MASDNKKNTVVEHHHDHHSHRTMLTINSCPFSIQASPVAHYSMFKKTNHSQLTLFRLTQHLLNTANRLFWPHLSGSCNENTKTCAVLQVQYHCAGEKSLSIFADARRNSLLCCNHSGWEDCNHHSGSRDHTPSGTHTSIIKVNSLTCFMVPLCTFNEMC